MERDLSDIVREHDESNEGAPICCMCGKVIERIFTCEALVEQDLCSWRCWAELYGEEGL
jgi:hypothetical protein